IAPGQPGPADARAFALGAAAWLALASLTAAIACGLQRSTGPLPWWLAAPVLAVLLKPMLAWRMLHDEVVAVEAALSQSLPAGRERLARLVSRDVQALEAVQVRESAIESLAENLNDSVVAPLFWFAVAGLP
ncbi:cobalamin biosynthesis protein, partial [Mesorhizobium waimense]